MDSHHIVCSLSGIFLALLQFMLPVESLSIDQIISEAATSPDAFNYIQDDVGTVKVELDMLYTADQWREIQELNATNIEDIRQKRKAVRPLHYRWTQKTIPYTIYNSHFNSNDRRVIQSALGEWMQYTCIRFRPATSADRNKISFQSGGGCSSFVGMLGQGSQPVTLGRGCRHKGVVIHEVGHALGFHHEQTRPDRDNYVTIVRQNIPSGVLFNFQKYSTGVINTYSVPYDYKSIMHYGATAFSTNGRRTIVTKDPRYQNVIGNRQGLSFRDIKLANTIYSCAANCAQKSCPGEGFVGKDCKCWCPGNPVKECSGTGVVQTTVRPNPSTSRPTTAPTTRRPTGNCNDMNSHCASWASIGECQKNPAYMLSFCKRSCNKCGGGGGTVVSCRDSSQWCSTWKGSGFCNAYQYRSYMNQNCKKSCNKCQNTYSAAGRIVGVSCTDNNGFCADWARRGECYKNQAYMLQQCKRSCNVCGTGKK